MDYSFSVIEDRWINVNDKKGNRLLVSLKDAMENADKYVSWSFPVPGEDLAVLRFLVALVHLYSEPEDFDDWKSVWKSRKLPEVLIKKIEDNSQYFNIFDSEKPFMQLWDSRDKKTRPITALYKTLPGKTATLHFRHYSFSDQYVLCVSCFISSLLSAHLYANSGGIAPKEEDGGRHFLAGLNGSAPLFLWAEGTSLFETVWLNVLCSEFQRNYIDPGFIGGTNRWPYEWDSFDVFPDEIGMADGILWRPRGIRAFLEENDKDRPCMVCGEAHDQIVREIDYRSGNHRLKEGSFWQDPMVARVHTQDGKITRASLSGFKEAERSGWKDFASLTYQEKRVAKTKDGEK